MSPSGTVAEFDAKGGRRVVLRHLRWKDLDTLVRFANTLVRERKTNQDLGIISLDKRVTKKDERKFLSYIIRGVRDKEVASVGAFVEGRLVGHCDLRRRKSSDVRHTGVFGIVILNRYRGIGIGERMMTEILEEARRMGIWLVELQVFAINDAAIHLYEKLGFRRVGVVPNKMLREGRHYDEIVMYADLRKR